MVTNRFNQIWGLEKTNQSTSDTFLNPTATELAQRKLIGTLGAGGEAIIPGTVSNVPPKVTPLQVILQGREKIGKALSFLGPESVESRVKKFVAQGINPTEAQKKAQADYAKDKAMNIVTGTVGGMNIIGNLSKGAIKQIASLTAEKKIIPILKKEIPNLADQVAEHLSLILKNVTNRKAIQPIVNETLSKLGAKAFVGKAAEEVAAKVSPLAQEAIPKVGQVVQEVIPKVDPEQEVINLLKSAESKRAEQELLYSQERAIRIQKGLVAEKIAGRGIAGLKAKTAAMGGEMSKVTFTPLQISQESADALVNKINDSPTIPDAFDKLTAQNGLMKMFAGVVPTEGELAWMEKVFSKDLIDTLVSKRPMLEKMTGWGLQLANIPRSIMASFDFSFGLRQGLVGGATHPILFTKLFIAQFKAGFSEKAFQEMQNKIFASPNYPVYKKMEIALTEVGGRLGTREERFASSWAEKIPIIGRFVRGSARAYTAFANKFRTDIADSLLKDLKTQGRDFSGDPKLLKELGHYINTITGRGDWKALEKTTTALNAVLFSPRLMISRLDLMTKMLRPSTYLTLDPFVRKQYLKSIIGFGGMVMTVLTGAKLAGADVETNPTSSDFGKIKIGNTRIDIAGGFQQYIRMTAQIATGKYTSSTTGKVLTLGKGYKPLTRKDIIMRQFESKEAPVMSFITDIMQGQTYTGQKVQLFPKELSLTEIQKGEITQRFIPMIIGDMADIARDNPDLLPVSFLGAFGAGIQTYKPTSTKSSGNRFNAIWGH